MFSSPKRWRKQSKTNESSSNGRSSSLYDMWHGIAVVADHNEDTDQKGRVCISYIIQVSTEGHRKNIHNSQFQWTLYKCYKEFSCLYKLMMDQPSVVFPKLKTYIFPNKSFLASSELDEKTINRRKVGFDALLKIATSAVVIPECVLLFLEVDKHVSTAVASDDVAGPSSDFHREVSRVMSLDRATSSMQHHRPPIHQLEANKSASLLLDISSGSSVINTPPVSQLEPQENTSNVVRSNNIKRPLKRSTIKGEQHHNILTGSSGFVNTDTDSEFDRALLRILQIEAVQLKDVELIGKNDVYLTLAFNDFRAKTTTISDCGECASWSTSGDKAFMISVTQKELRELNLKIACFDENELKKDVMIGRGEVSMRAVYGVGLYCQTTIKIALHDEKDMFAGLVCISLDLIPHPDTVAIELSKTQEYGIIFALFYVFIFLICRIVYVIIRFDYRKFI